MKISKKASGLVGSEILKLAAKIRQKQSEGEKVYNLTIGDFNPSIYPIPKELEDGIIEAYRNKQTNYPPANGIPEIREAISKFIYRTKGLEYSPDEILISSGARTMIYATFQTLLDPGDKVMYPVPSWNNNHYTHLAEGERIIIDTLPENHFLPTAEQLKDRIKEASLLTLCSPLNPSGTMFEKTQLEDICDLVIEENKRRGGNQKPLYIMFDQIYWLLTYGDAKHYDPVSLRPELKPYTFFIDGLSKAFAATGVRTGWYMGPAEITAKMKALVGHMGAWSPRPEQTATAKFLSNIEAYDGYLLSIKDRLQTSLLKLYEGLKKLNRQSLPVDVIYPNSAIYLTVKFDFRGYTTPEGKVLKHNHEVNSFLLEEGKVGLVPFYAFGANDDLPWYRLSVGTVRHEDIPDILSNLEQAFAKLKK